MASDEGGRGSGAGQRAGSSGFVWVSSSPSPAEIERLETAFPEVVAVPVAELMTEMTDWQARAVIARSFQKWVPVEAFVREFRRAGIQGGIKPISLAFRCHTFLFDDPNAAESVMNRPWVINGQIIGMERWKPEFVPSADAIPFALVWVRLPNLPLEFWKEEFLKAISEAAGQFHCIDESTLAKNRGGFARICLRVDLRRPLRPGTRVQGINLPFWQQFVYEFIEGFCPSCGSLHLEGPCSVESGTGKEEAGSSPVFGSWLTAVRHRRDAPGAKREERKQTHPKLASVGPGSASVSQRSQGLDRSVAGEAGEWRTPTKVAHRRVIRGSKTVVAVDHGASGSGGAVLKGMMVDSAKGEAVPVSAVCAGTVASEKGLLNDNLNVHLNVPNVVGFCQEPADSNPFASLGLGLGGSRDQGMGDAFPGPLKRARPVDCPAPRSSPKAVRSKGKGKVSLTKNLEMGQLCQANMSLLPCTLDKGQEVSKSIFNKKGGVSVEDPSIDISVAASEGLKSDALMINVGGNPISESLPEMAMLEDHGEVQASSSFK